MGRIGTIARRTFLIGTATIAGGLAVGYYMGSRPYDNPLKTDLADDEATFNPFVKISTDSTVTVIVPRAEMGQGVTTTLAALVAEELDLSLDDIKIEHGPASSAYYNAAMIKEGGPFAFFDESFLAETVRDVSGFVAHVLGLQGTGGSSSVTDAFMKMRKAGAAAREILLQAGANSLNIVSSRLVLENGVVRDVKSGREIKIGDLVSSAATIAPSSNVRMKSPKDWKLLGKSQPRVDMVSKVTGTAQFGIDVELPDMLHGTVVLNPNLDGDVISFDASAAEKMAGVKKVVNIGVGIGVIADNTWRAFEAAKAVKVKWGEASYPKSSKEIFEHIGKAVETGEGFALRNDGDAEKAVNSASKDGVLEAEYKAPFLAHFAMEPMNTTAQWKDGKLDLWLGAQVPTGVQIAAEREFNIGREDIRLHQTLLGGGFGRRLEFDFALYAMRMAKHTNGKPVKVTWTREQDTKHDKYRPAAIGRFKAVVSKGKAPAAVHGRIAAPSIMASFVKRAFPGMEPGGPDRLISEGAFDQPYNIPNYYVEGIDAGLSMPVGFWRSVGNSYNGFFHESFMDEIAHKSGLDPVKMRLELMSKWPAAYKTVEKVAEMCNWQGPKSAGAGRGRGVAFTISFGTWVAQIVEVSLQDDQYKIEKVWCAADLGLVLDPENVKRQMRSGIIFGLSSALGQEITFADGKVEQENFDSYPAMKLNQTPEIEVALLQNAKRMGGAGEPGTPPSIPALANAIFDASGKRIRELPLSKHVSFFE